jgi:hypothetical protein
LALIFNLPVGAADVEVWNGVELELVNTNRWQVRARGEVRSTGAFGDLLTLRGIGDVRFSVAPKFALLGQFQYVEGKTRIGWEEASRITGGFEVPFRGENRTFAARTLVEQFWLPQGLTYTRLRERAAWRWTRVPLQPQLMAEVMADAQGWAASRPSFTVLIPAGKHMDLDVGYHFDFRPGRLGGNRHIVHAYVRIRRQAR